MTISLAVNFRRNSWKSRIVIDCRNLLFDNYVLDLDEIVISHSTNKRAIKFYFIIINFHLKVRIDLPTHFRIIYECGLTPLYRISPSRNCYRLSSSERCSCLDVYERNHSFFVFPPEIFSPRQECTVDVLLAFLLAWQPVVITVALTRFICGFFVSFI